MAPGEPILIVCHSFPPNYGIGGRRWAKFAKELTKRGHPVHVIRKEFKGGPKSLWTSDGETAGIFHHPLPARSPTVFHRWPLTSFSDKLRYRFWLRVMPFLTKGNWIDPAALWKNQLVKKANELIAQHGIRQVVVSGAPFSLLVHGMEFRSPHGDLHLVGDFRDPWTWGPYYGQAMLSPAHMDHERRMEATVARTYHRLLTPNDQMREHLHKMYGGKPERYVTIPNAIDPEDFGTLPARPTEDGMFKMIYAGSLYGAEEAERYFDELLRTFEGMRGTRPEALANCSLDLYITGQGIQAFEKKVAAKGLEGTIRFHAPIPPERIFQKLAASDLVISFIPSFNKDIMGTKFNEIFQLRRPLLHVGEPGLVSQTILGRKLGGSLRVEALRTELPRIIARELKLELDPNADVSEFLLERVTNKLMTAVLV